jgi:hypothetical protein
MVKEIENELLLVRHWRNPILMELYEPVLKKTGFASLVAGANP